MSQLHQAYQLLAFGISQDPLLCLAHAATVFDPFRPETVDDDLDDYFYSAEGALVLLRRAFPDIYAVAASAYQSGASYGDLDELICSKMDQQGFPLSTIEGMLYGIPLPAYGVVLHEEEFYTSYSHLVPVVELLFGAKIGDEYPADVPEHTYTISQQLMNSLIEHDDERWKSVGWLMGFIGSATGNTCVDFDWDSMAEMQPLAWEPDDIAFARAIIEEADEIMDSAMAGLKLFETDPQVRRALKRNITRLRRALETKKESSTNVFTKLRWPKLDNGLTGTTESDT